MRYFTWKLEFVSDILWVNVGQKHTEDSLSTNPETYLGRLTEWSTDLGTKTLALKKQFSGFLFSVVLPQKKYVIVEINDQSKKVSAKVFSFI